MRKSPIFVSSLLLAAHLTGQGMPAPAQQVDHFDPLVGSWRGTGSAVMEPGAPPMNWTAATRAAKTLGDHWVREDTSIEFGGSMPPLLFRSFYGWDAERQQHVAYMIANDGTGDVVDVRVAERAFHYSNRRLEDGREMFDHWTVRWAEDGNSYEMIGRRSIEGGDMFLHVQGNYTRADDAKPKATDAAFSPMGQPDTQHMDKFANAVGTYRMEGKVRMTPSMPTMPVLATEDVSLVWGGTMLEMKVEGDPSPMGVYEGWGALFWDAGKGCYTNLWLSNMGECAESRAWWLDDTTLAFFEARQAMGQPMAARTLMMMDEHGAFDEMETHSLTGEADPMVSFDAQYTKQ
ncbi:MAG: DUF1579 family protein [Planctomycetota bacterium]